MQALGARLYSLFAILLFFAAAGLRLSMLLLNLSQAATAVYYLMLSAGAVMLALKAFKSVKYNSAFSSIKRRHLNISAFVASLGFFIDFVHKCVNAYNSFAGGTYKNPTFFMPICVAAVFALLSCYYFYTVSLTYSSKSYDFRYLKLMHFSPLVWSGAQLLIILYQTPNARTDIDEIVKCFVFILSACFFYRFSAEIEETGETKASTVFCSLAFLYLSTALFINRIMLFFSHLAEIDNDDGVTSVTMLMVAVYAAFFEKSIANHSISEEI